MDPQHDWKSIVRDHARKTGVADLAVRVGLLTPDQVQEAWDEVGKRGGEPEPHSARLQPPRRSF